MRRLDIGIASYGAPAKLERTLQSIITQSTTDYRIFVIHNPGGAGDDEARMVIAQYAEDPRVVPIFAEMNLGYAGAVKRLMEIAETEYIAYCDNDIIIETRGWDEILCGFLDRYHEIGLMFPNGGAYRIQRPGYVEVMWGVGFCWILSRIAMKDTGLYDDELGHQEEADYCLRLRMAGYRCACSSAVSVQHDASATSDPSQIERINRGVIAFVNKWTRYFGGKNLNYHSPNVLRWEDWPPNALYLEEYWRSRLPGLNDSPEVRVIENVQYDLIKVPRLHEFYRGRVI